MNEDYVSFETAKLLKENGFVVDNVSILVSNDNNHFLSGNTGYDFLLKNGYEVYPAPTFQEAMKWMRNVYKIHFEILMTNHSISIRYDIPKYYWVAVNTENCDWVTESTVYDPTQFDTNEEACDDAIKCYLKRFCKNE